MTDRRPALAVDQARSTFPHRLPTGELVEQVVEVADLLHQRLLDLFDPDTADDSLGRGRRPVVPVRRQNSPASRTEACDTGTMSSLRDLGRVVGWSCIAIGGVQLVAGTRGEPGMTDDATVDSHVRFMGPVFAGYGVGWLDAAAADEPDLDRMRVLAGLMALGGAGRLATRATVGRPHRFHDLLLGIELAAPLVVEALGRRERAARQVCP